MSTNDRNINWGCLSGYKSHMRPQVKIRSTSFSITILIVGLHLILVGARIDNQLELHLTPCTHHEKKIRHRIREQEQRKRLSLPYASICSETIYHKLMLYVRKTSCTSTPFGFSILLRINIKYVRIRYEYNTRNSRGENSVAAWTIVWRLR